MSGVVLRCSNCGTVQAGMGECEACHEAQVRYFCRNHAPGLWLDAPLCSQCGARFAGSPRTAPSIDPRLLPDVAPTVPVLNGERTEYRVTPTSTPDGGPPTGFRIPTAGTLLEAFAYAARERRMRRARTDDAEAPARGSGGGCAGRLLSLALLLVALFLLVPIFLGGALLRMF
jgi:hypothetical protein